MTCFCGESQKDFDFEIDPDSNEPQILIYHTHATESFELTEKNYYEQLFFHARPPILKKVLLL